VGTTKRLLAAIAGASLIASCSPAPRSAGAEAAPAAAASASAPETLVPDGESEAIPTAGGIPLVPLTGEVNFLDALDPQPVYSLPHVYNTNHTAVQIIKEEEQLRLEAYELGGLWLIGYGHLMLEGEKDAITEEEADVFLREDLHWCEEAIERYVKVKRVNQEDRTGAANAFLLWNRMNGVVMKALANRRARERTLFLTP
jgi:GH24 family phage-related lysozyme (muramidase)